MIKKAAIYVFIVTPIVVIAVGAGVVIATAGLVTDLIADAYDPI